jgi:hypothetical protein
MKRIIKITVWVIALSVTAYGVLLALSTLLTSLIGGPREPPSNMSWGQFRQWIDSGAWFRESIATSISCILIPLVVAGLVTHLTRSKDKTH